jgi:hypothetical protein
MSPRASHDELQAFMEEWQELLSAADAFERETARALRLVCACASSCLTRILLCCPHSPAPDCPLCRLARRVLRALPFAAINRAALAEAGSMVMDVFQVLGLMPAVLACDHLVLRDLISRLCRMTKVVGTASSCTCARVSSRRCTKMNARYKNGRSTMTIRSALSVLPVLRPHLYRIMIQTFRRALRRTLTRRLPILGL